MFVLYKTNNMKILGNSVVLTMVLAALFTYSGCGPDPVGPTVEEVQLEALTGTWAVTGGSSSVTTNVTLDNVSKKSPDYAAFELTLSGTPGATSFAYTTAGRPPLSAWPSTGTWKFGESPESMITRDPTTTDELPVTYAVAGDQLQITFNFAKTGYSRTNQVTGEWVFTLARK